MITPQARGNWWFIHVFRYGSQQAASAELEDKPQAQTLSELIQLEAAVPQHLY